ncbi:MAG: cyclic peptide export ABC transporter [Polyangiales bacterium]
MSLVLFLAKSSRAWLLAGLVTSVANGLLAARVVALMNASLRAERAELLALGLSFALASVAMMALRWLSLSLFVRLGQLTLARLRMHISRYVAEAPYRELEEKGAASLLATLTEDVSTVGEGFMMLPWLFVHAVVVLGCLGYLALLSWQAFVFFLAVAALGSLGYATGARRAHGLLRVAREGEDELFGHFRALFSGAKELKLHAPRREAFLSGALAGSAERVRVTRTRGLQSHSRLANWRVFLFFAAIGGVLFGFGPTLGVESDTRSGYALMLLYMMLPVNALLEATPALSRMKVAIERIEALGLGVTTLAPARAPRPLQSIELRGVCHQYRREDSVFTLGPIDLTLTPGELVFIVGGNGGGKTTLAKVLVGLYPPESGLILRDGVPVGEPEREDYRQQFAAVFSDFHLFESLLGMNAIELDDRAHTLLMSLDLVHKVRIENGAFSTTALSSGQRKRLALLVAWLDDRPLYVFDEWAADQDPVYKDVFYRELLPALKQRGKSVVVITHDDRYFGLADRLLKLELGQLTEPDVAFGGSAESTGVHARFELPALRTAGQP